MAKGFDPQPKTYDELKDAVINHCQLIKSACVERHIFWSCKQDSDESINDYVARLRTLACSCDFDSTKVDTVSNQLIRDQLIIGANNTKVSEVLLREGDLKLSEALKIFNLICKLIFERARYRCRK